MTKTYQIRAASIPVVQNGFPLVGSLFDSGLCPRVSFLRSHDIEKPADEKAQGYFAAGIKHEETFIADLEASGVEIEYQADLLYQVRPNITVGGHPDIIIKSTGEILELKSVHSPNSYKSKFKKGYTGADWTHVSQLAKYLVMLDAPTGKIVYTSYAEGHEGEQREVPVTYDGTVVRGGGHEIEQAWLKEGLDVAIRQLETDTLHSELPIVKPEPKQDVCQRCPLNQFCYNQLGKVKGEELRKFAVNELGWGARKKD